MQPAWKSVRIWRIHTLVAIASFHVAFARPFLGLRENDLCIGKIALFPSRLPEYQSVPLLHIFDLTISKRGKPLVISLLACRPTERLMNDIAWRGIYHLVRDWPTVTISLSMSLAIENIVLGIQILYSLSEEKREVRQQAHHHDIID